MGVYCAPMSHFSCSYLLYKWCNERKMKSFFISTEFVVVSLHKIGCGSAKIASKLASLRSPCTIFECKTMTDWAVGKRHYRLSLNCLGVMPVSFLKKFAKCGTSAKPKHSAISFTISLFSANNLLALTSISLLISFIGLNP